MEEFKPVLDTLDETKDKQIELKDLYEKSEDGKYVFKFATKSELESISQQSKAEVEERERQIGLMKEEKSGLEKRLEIKEQQISMSTGELKEKHEKEKKDIMDMLVSKTSDVAKLSEESKEMAGGYEKAQKEIEALRKKNNEYERSIHHQKIYKELETTFIELGIEDPSYKNDMHFEATKVFRPHVDYDMVGYDDQNKEMFSKDAEGKLIKPTTPGEWLKSQLQNGKKATMWKQGCTKFATKGSGIQNLDSTVADMDPGEKARAYMADEIAAIIGH